MAGTISEPSPTALLSSAIEFPGWPRVNARPATIIIALYSGYGLQQNPFDAARAWPCILRVTVAS